MDKIEYQDWAQEIQGARRGVKGRFIGTQPTRAITLKTVEDWKQLVEKSLGESLNISRAAERINLKFCA